MRRRLVAAVGIAGLALAAAVWWSTLRDHGPDHRPNVLIVVWDTARADHLSVYGYDRPTTPRIAKLAERAVVFDRASSAGIWTLPSHASMFTGLAPESHGADERWLWLDDRFTTIAEAFRDDGYATFTLAANTLLCEETNLTQGFDVRLNTYKGKLAKVAKAATQRKLILGDLSHELAPGWVPPAHGAHNAEWARAAFKEAAPLAGHTLLEWLSRRKTTDEPFFAFVNLMEAHTPRIPSMASRQQVMAGDPALIQLGLTTDAAHINLHFYNFGKYTYSDRQLAAITGVYDAALADLDRATADLLDELDRRGILDDTIVVLTADHGENLGDHHLFNHRFALWDSLVHVPLIVWAPGQAPGRVARPVSTLDLFANVARLAGVEPPDGISDHDWFGSVDAPAVTGLDLPLAREIETVHAVYPDVAVAPWLRQGHAIVDGGYKLIDLTTADGDRSTALFDLAADPGELAPVDDPQRTAALLDETARWVAGWPPYDPADRGPGDDPAHVRASQDDLRAQLEALGYTAPTGDEPVP
ncbi:MAG: sulfatase [Myxococcota bacterium]